MLGVTIRIGAGHWDLSTPDGQVIDLSSLDRSGRNKARGIIRGIYQKHLEETQPHG